MEQHDEPEAVALLVDLHHRSLVGEEPLELRMDLDAARAARGGEAEVLAPSRPVGVNRGEGHEAIACRRPLDRIEPALARVVAERQADRDRQDRGAPEADAIHLGDEVRNRVRGCGVAAEEELLRDLAGDLGAHRLVERRVDVDVEVEGAAGILAVAVEQVAGSRGPPAEVDVGGEEEVHPEVSVHVDGRWKVEVDDAKLAVIVQLEVRQLGETAVAAEDELPVGSAPGIRGLTLHLVRQARSILFGVVRRRAATGADQGGDRRRGEP
jgi:hypothetical protein